MIQEFSAENIYSIRERQTLSFVASKDTSSQELLTHEIKPNLRLLKLVILYGANASGKTNLLFAMQQLWQLLFFPKLSKEEPITYAPFLLDRNSSNKPIVLSAIFYINTIKYQYSITYNQQHIISEELKYAPNGILSKFYTRTISDQQGTPKIEFGDTLALSAKAKNILEANTLHNHTVLSTFAKVTVEAAPFMVIYQWLKNTVHSVVEPQRLVEIAKSVLSDDRKKRFFLNAIKKADFNISNLSIVEENNELPQSIIEAISKNDLISPKDKERLLSGKKENVQFSHTTENGEFPLDKELQSLGTLQYFTLLDKLYDMINGNHIYMIDEVEDQLHYDLLIDFLSSFLLNSNEAQLIVTTHNQQLLVEDFIRRDMVWFAEKNRQSAASEFYSAADFGLHKNISLYNAYRSGRLGAKPSTGSIILED